MSAKGPGRRRGRPTGTTKLRARPAVDKLATTRGFDHLLSDVGRAGVPGQAGVPSAGEFLFQMLVEGTAEAKGAPLGKREIKRAIRSRRRALKEKSD